MPYVLLATGALMTIAGFYAVVTGYGIVQIEQGWTAVISGTTLIAGGVVTMAMAAILRTLQQMRAGLAGLPIGAAPAVLAPVLNNIPVPAPAEEAAPLAEAPAAPVVTPIFEEPATASAAQPLADSPSLDAALEPLPVPPPPPEPIAPPPPPTRIATRPLAPYSSDDFKRTSAGALKPVPPPEEEPAAPQPVVEEPASPPMDDWLDRAFADLDQVRQAPPPREPAPPLFEGRAPEIAPVPTREPAPREPAYAGMPASAPLTVAVAAEPEPEPVTEAAPPPPAATPDPEPTSAVIGRYEADGTSYTMYADGSIEAQSEAGVYRFASMAELKAFIEA